MQKLWINAAQVVTCQGPGRARRGAEMRDAAIQSHTAVVAERGKIIAVLAKKSRVIVEGVQMIKKHTRKSQQHPQGAIVDREGSIHISNVVKAEHVEQPAEATA